MGQSEWTFLTNHAHVALCLASQPCSTIRDMAQRVGITERAVQHILNDLVEAGYLERTRVGRSNQYRLCPDQPLRHPVESHRNLEHLIRMVYD